MYSRRNLIPIHIKECFPSPQTRFSDLRSRFVDPRSLGIRNHDPAVSHNGHSSRRYNVTLRLKVARQNCADTVQDRDELAVLARANGSSVSIVFRGFVSSISWFVRDRPRTSSRACSMARGAASMANFPAAVLQPRVLRRFSCNVDSCSVHFAFRASLCELTCSCSVSVSPEFC